MRFVIASPRIVTILAAFVMITIGWTASADALCVGKKRKRGTAKHKKQAKKFCKQYMADNPGKKCKADKRICPRGYVAQKKFKGCGINYSACVKGRKISRLKKRRQQGRKEAADWCKKYTASSGSKCKFVKTGKFCPRGYRILSRIRNRGMRNYKFCVKGRKLRRKQRLGANCDPKLGGYATRALKWLSANYSDVTGGFRMSGRKYKNRRIKRRLKRRFKSVKVVCYKRNTGVCARKGLGGLSKGQPFKIHICFKRQPSFCGLVSTLFHEIAHNARVPKSKRKVHNDFNNPARLNDHVYRLGARARDACVNANANFDL